jgi:ParB/RepB/Spo0J family partition protein
MDTQIHDPAVLIPHPLARPFPQEGGAWECLLASISRRGVLFPAVARATASGIQLIDGHRRTAAAARCGALVPVHLVECSALEALEMILAQSIHAESFPFLSRARLAQHMKEEFYLTDAELAERLAHSVAQVKDLLELLDLPEEVACRLDLPPGHEERVELAAARELLKVPVHLRKKAARMLLHPEFQSAPLDAPAAREIFRAWLIDPAEAELSWEYRGALLAEAAAVEYADVLGGVAVKAAPWSARKSARQQGVDPFMPVPRAALTAGIPAGTTWIDIARAYGVPCLLVPTDSEPVLLINRIDLEQADGAALDAGKKVYLQTTKHLPL